MIVVDTGAWFACFVSQDPRHAQASEWYLNNSERLVTSDHILVELFTLLKARGQYRIALTVGDDRWSGSLAHIEYAAAIDLAGAWNAYKSFHDKRWSLVDCLSRVVMQRLSISRAFAFDEHFRQFGTVAVVP